MFKIKLGTKVISTISGFMGIATSRAEHLNGCNRYWIAPTVDKDGKLPDGLWLDEGELEACKPALAKSTKEHSGGFPSKIK